MGLRARGTFLAFARKMSFAALGNLPHSPLARANDCTPAGGYMRWNGIAVSNSHPLLDTNLQRLDYCSIRPIGPTILLVTKQ